jgi:hypothetical protein
MRKLIESTPVSLDGVIGSPDCWSPFEQLKAQPARPGRSRQRKAEVATDSR